MKKKKKKNPVCLLKEDIISFETAKLAKQAGFWYNGNTNDWLNTTLPYHDDGKRNIDFCYRGEEYSAPTQTLLQKWLREKHKVLVEAGYRKFSVKGADGYFYLCGTTKYWNTDSYIGETLFKGWKTYEDALEIGLQIGLKIVISRIADEKRKAGKEKKV